MQAATETFTVGSYQFNGSSAPSGGTVYTLTTNMKVQFGVSGNTWNNQNSMIIGGKGTADVNNAYSPTSNYFAFTPQLSGTLTMTFNYNNASGTGSKTVSITSNGAQVSTVSVAKGQTGDFNISSLNVNAKQTYYVFCTVGSNLGFKSYTLTYQQAGSTLNAPTVSIAKESFGTGYYTTITNNASGATVYYTTDCSDPRTSQSSFKLNSNSESYSLEHTITIRAVAVLGSQQSDIAEATYIDTGSTLCQLNSQPTIGKKYSVDGMQMTYGCWRGASTGETVKSTSGKWGKGTLGSSAFGYKSSSDRVFSADNVYNSSYDAMTEDAKVTNGKPTIYDYDGGTITGKPRRGEFDHNKTNKSRHVGTFNLPTYGAFFIFEPTKNGELVIFVDQQGSLNTKSNNGGYRTDQVRKRPAYLLDESGRPVKANYAYTVGSVPTEWGSVTESTINNCQNENMYQAQQEIEYMNFYNAYMNYVGGGSFTLGKTKQDVIRLHSKNEYPQELQRLLDQMNANTGDDVFDENGYMVHGEAFVRYSFPVKAGKTYFLTGYRTKLSLVAYQFYPESDYATKGNVTLTEGTAPKAGETPAATNSQTLATMQIGSQYNITLQRTFPAGKWSSLVLPFSISPTQFATIFGSDARCLHFREVNHGKNKLILKEHYYNMVVAGTPIFVLPKQNVVNPTFTNVTLEMTDDSGIDEMNGNEYNDGGSAKITGSFDPAWMPAHALYMSSNTFKQSAKQKATKGLRAWIDGAGEGAAAKLSLFEDIMEDQNTGIATGIDEVTPQLPWETEGLADVLPARAPVFSLQGQRVAASALQHLPQGIYIVNGKKYVVK